MKPKIKVTRIIGVDPGTGIVGFGVIDFNGGNGYKLVDAGVIRTPVNQALESRLVTIYEELCNIIKLNQPNVMSIEKLFFAQNVTTAISVSHARGVIMLAGKQNGLEIAEYTPLQIKQALTGYGRADKKQIQEMVQQVLKLKSPIKQDDCADGIAAAICHAMTNPNIRVSSTL
jgi:crossover junction endodeoxyribonuclease RuvC